ncbi:MAG: single-stranded DNA-binding protein [Clostridiales bacterium]|nr:single-stranded DNA-binding protein [Clostridiales bacterium]
MEGFINNNHVTLDGRLKTDFIYDSDDMYGRKIYKADLEIPRYSYYPDIVTVLASDQLVDVKSTFAGSKIRIAGMLQSDAREDKRGFVFSVYACDFALADKTEERVNIVSLEAYVCRKPFARLTSHQKAVTTILVAVMQENGKEMYIPCTIGSKYALHAVAMEVGTQLEITGSIRSRRYVIKDGSDTSVTYTHMVRVKEYRVIESDAEILSNRTRI